MAGNELLNQKMVCIAIVLGTVTGIHIADEVIIDGKIDVTIYQPLARLGYMDYAQITTLFEMKRPAV